MTPIKAIYNGIQDGPHPFEPQPSGTDGLYLPWTIFLVKY